MENFGADEKSHAPPVSEEMFREWRSPRSGRSNPERMNNPVWEWLIQSGISAYQASQLCNGSSKCDAGPGWCFDRFGQSSTLLPNGTTVLIGGEHEDFYDSDFFIYNDVVLRRPDGAIEIFGYPLDTFPPTDFHSATLVGDCIVIIGNLGYKNHRKPGTTQVLTLDLRSLAVRKTSTSGEPPGWLHKHRAIMSNDGLSILISGGELDPGGVDSSWLENIDDWRLNISDWRWERLSTRTWQRLEVRRSDRRPNHLWEIKHALWERSVGWGSRFKTSQEQLAESGLMPDWELAPRLYKPDILHEGVPKREDADDEHNVTRIMVQNVVVRYVAKSHSVQMTVEGELPKKTVEALGQDLCRKMEALECASCEVKTL